MQTQTLSIAGHTISEMAQSKAQKVGAEFEGILLNMVLGAVDKSFSELPGAKLLQETEAYSGFGMQALTSGLARAGGIGLAKMISSALEKSRPGQDAR